jgi:hypothetical protein
LYYGYYLNITISTATSLTPLFNAPFLLRILALAFNVVIAALFSVFALNCIYVSAKQEQKKRKALKPPKDGAAMN